MDIADLIRIMKEAGILFDRGLSEEEAARAEELYGIRFPTPLRSFLRTAVPISDENLKNCFGDPCPEEMRRAAFPHWHDFSPENTAEILDWMKKPFRRLKNDVRKNGFWAEEWGERPVDPEDAAERFERISSGAPKLIPLYLHRFIPSGDTGEGDPPVFSTVGMDTIWYGNSFEEWGMAEFSDRKIDHTVKNEMIPFWDDVVGQNMKYIFR